MDIAREILEKHLSKDLDIKSYLRTSPLTYQVVLDAIEEAINYTHCCTELKTLKQGEKLILDNKFDVEVVAPSEKNVLIKYKETDRVVWVNEQRLKRK